MVNYLLGRLSILTLDINEVINLCVQLHLVLVTLLTLSSLVFSVSNATLKAGTVTNVSRLAIPIIFYCGFFIQLSILFYFLINYQWVTVTLDVPSVSQKLPFVCAKFGSLSVDLFGTVLVLLAYLVGFISFLCLNDKAFWNNSKHSLIFSYFLSVITLFTVCDDVYNLFILYELLLLPSAILVYYNSVNKRGIKASLYFLVWTQLGSLLVFFGIQMIASESGTTSLNNIQVYYESYAPSTVIIFLIFFGFGFKVPVWPFHFWLTKTHVEATGSFSMYLSGFLVKTALFGFYKLTIALNYPLGNEVFMAIAVYTSIEASLKMWTQVDLKKLVAYCTVQEMNLMIMCFLFGHSSIFIAGILFCFMHGVLSSLMFFLVDCLQRRYQSRQTSAITGVLHTTPLLGLSIIFMVISYLALPGTLKFTCEVMLFSSLSDLSTILLVLTLVSASWIAPIAFFKLWLGCVFGTPSQKNLKINDLDTREALIISFCLFFFVFLSGFSYHYL